ncbi:hypothetical protein WA158_000082 [Blastocystis sp. Blastoise]
MSEPRACSNPECKKVEEVKGSFKTCSRCKKAIYCSKECQVAHWKNGHKQACKPVQPVSKPEPSKTEQSNVPLKMTEEVLKLQEDLRQTIRSYTQVSNSLAVNQSEKKSYEVMSKYLEGVNDNQKSYYMYGKCFMQMPKTDIQNAIEINSCKCKDQISILTKQQEFFAKKQLEIESNIKETQK